MSLPLLLENLTDSLLNKYNTRGPRYTSYPTAPLWQDNFAPERFEQAILESNTQHTKPTDLSVYVHLPFCAERCLYCSCNMVISPKPEPADEYLTYLFKEIEMTSKLFDDNRSIAQLHWGGGTPTYHTPQQLEKLFQHIAAHFPFKENAETALEVDPRVTTHEHLEVLRAAGFNRISMGLQDFDSDVQQMVNRIQPQDMTQAMIEGSRQLGFHSINLDLIYGLPGQSHQSFEKTIDAVIPMAPDRIALYNYAHVPWISPHQKYLDATKIPDAAEKVDIFCMALSKLLDAGYVYIGMDHFAKPDDELAQALAAGTLHRNFMGYTVLTYETDMISFGSSAISDINGCYAQNHKKLSKYYESLSKNELPVNRGTIMTDDDKLRRRVILDILCKGEVHFEHLEASFNINANEYFEKEQTKLPPLEADGLLEIYPGGFKLTPLGRLLSRNVAMIFDAYLAKQTEKGENRVFSRTV